MSWRNLTKQGGSPDDDAQTADDPTATPADGQQAEQQQFTQQDLELQWMAMCNRMPQQLVGIAARMKNIIPTITDFPAVEVVAENQLVQEQMEQIKRNIVKTLQLHLHHSGITLTIRIAEPHEQERILSRREQFELMEKENPAVGKLRELFGLELA